MIRRGNTQSLPERDITSLYFETKLITRLRPDNPAEIEPELSDEILIRVQLITLMTGQAACEMGIGNVLFCFEFKL